MVEVLSAIDRLDQKRSGYVLFDEMRLLPQIYDATDLMEIQEDLQNNLQEVVGWWLDHVPENAVIHEARTAISVSYNELAWMLGVVVERVNDHLAKCEFMRVARSFYTLDKRALALLSSRHVSVSSVKT